MHAGISSAFATDRSVVELTHEWRSLTRAKRDTNFTMAAPSKTVRVWVYVQEIASRCARCSSRYPQRASCVKRSWHWSSYRVGEPARKHGRVGRSCRLVRCGDERGVGQVHGTLPPIRRRSCSRQARGAGEICCWAVQQRTYFQIRSQPKNRWGIASVRSACWQFSR